MGRRTPTANGRSGGRRAQTVAGSYSIRAVRLSDVPVVVRLRTRMMRELGHVGPRAIARHARVVAPWIEHELRARRLWGYLAVGPDNTPLASGLLWLKPRNPSPRFPHTRIPYILSMYTAPPARRRGIAGEIVRALVDSARARGYPRVELHASRAGYALYKSLGFRPTDEMRLELGPRPRRPSPRRSPVR